MGGGKPFGTGGRGAFIAPKTYVAFDDSRTPDRKYFEEMMRATKNQIIFGANYFAEFLKNSSCWIVWDKDNSGNFADCELAWTNFKTATRIFKWRWNGMLQEDMKNKEERFHPTQKPIALFQWCLENYSSPGDLIIDPFCGSGTTALACHKTGRRFICIDKEPKYIAIAQKRYAELVAQEELFKSAPYKSRETAANNRSAPALELDFGSKASAHA